jgi:hypothetical protein
VRSGVDLDSQWEVGLDYLSAVAPDCRSAEGIAPKLRGESRELGHPAAVVLGLPPQQAGPQKAVAFAQDQWAGPKTGEPLAGHRARQGEWQFLKELTQGDLLALRQPERFRALAGPTLERQETRPRAGQPRWVWLGLAPRRLD